MEPSILVVDRKLVGGKYAYTNKMTKSAEQLLREEYVNNLNSIILWPLKFAGYLRFETEDGRIIKKERRTIIRSLLIILIGNLSAAYTLYITAYQENYLSETEITNVIYISVIQNCVIINIAFPNRNSGLALINGCIEIDTVLGIEETKFMRNIIVVVFIVLSIIVCFFQGVVTIVLYNAYDVSASIHFVGTIYFAMVFLIFFDACFLVSFFNFLSLRVHYINIALMKLANVNPDYFANQLFFNGILWKKTHDKLVTFHYSAEPSQYIQVIRIMFDLLRRLEKCFRFSIFIALLELIIGTFVGVQAIIINRNRPSINVLRTISVTGWVYLGWIYILLLSQYIDIFFRQIEKTKLICTYIQLKPVMSARVLKLTKDVLSTMEMHEPRVSIYSMFYFNTSLILKITGSIFVYITVQLQLLVPNRISDGAPAANKTDLDLVAFI